MYAVQAVLWIMVMGLSSQNISLNCSKFGILFLSWMKSSFSHPHADLSLAVPGSCLLKQWVIPACLDPVSALCSVYTDSSDFPILGLSLAMSSQEARTFPALCSLVPPSGLPPCLCIVWWADKQLCKLKEDTGWIMAHVRKPDPGLAMHSEKKRPGWGSSLQAEHK